MHIVCLARTGFWNADGASQAQGSGMARGDTRHHRMVPTVAALFPDSFWLRLEGISRSSCSRQLSSGADPWVALLLIQTH